MNVADELLQAIRLPNNSGWTYTLASRLGQMLSSAEQQFGPRDASYTVLGFEFAGDIPQIWYPENCRHVVIQLGPNCASDPVRACYQLAHECIHLLSPTGRSSGSTVLEEGLATVFSYRYIRNTFNIDMSRSGDVRYDEAAAAVEKLLAIAPNAVAQLRTQQQVISLIDAPLIFAHYPAVRMGLADELARRFS